VLPKSARLTAGEDFAKATKSGLRLTTTNLVGYLHLSNTDAAAPAKCGLIVNKSVGGSVTRHRIARQIRHSIAPQMGSLPNGSLLVIRVLKEVPLFIDEVTNLVGSLLSRSKKSSSSS